jgi:hypothetical protein
MTARRFPPPWTVAEHTESVVTVGPVTIPYKLVRQ